MDGTGVVKGRGKVEPGPLDAKMNRTEAEYAKTLGLAKTIGLIHSWHFQRLTFILGPDLRYTPDFMVVQADGFIRFDEIKGYEREDAVVKFKLAAELHPWASWRMIERARPGAGVEVTWNITREY
jgi:hypothetical protein